MAVDGTYRIVKLLPSDGEEHQYRIKSASEAFERVAKESQLGRCALAHLRIWRIAAAAVWRAGITSRTNSTMAQPSVDKAATRLILFVGSVA